MSLIAKLEAVIYAAEEPVTLAQLAALFADEALACKAEREAAAAAAIIEAQAPADETLSLVDQGFADLGLGPTPPSYAAEPAQDREAADAEPATTGGNDESAGSETAARAAPANLAAAEAAEPAEAEAETDAKREARTRDREVRAFLKQLIDELVAGCASDDRGIEIREIAGGYRMATKPECHDAVRQFVRSLKPPLKLSLPALETLAVVAYKQPVTAPEVSEIRGVESAATLGSLLSRKLIATAGRKPVVGRPILYKTTREFLLRFGLKDVSELPSMEEFEKMAAVELDEQAPADESGEPSEEAQTEIELSDAFERTGDDAAEGGQTRGEVPENNPAHSSPGAAEASQPVEAEASRHES
jgi:segregation and condensation protein B